MKNNRREFARNGLKNNIEQLKKKLKIILIKPSKIILRT